MAESDAVAIARTLAGEQDCFRILVERYSRGVFGLAFRMTANEQDAEDVVQETFLRAYRGLKNYDGRAGFGTWLYRIAANYSLDLIRARRSPESSVDTLDVPAGQPPADRLVYSGQVQHRLNLALEELSVQERTAFSLRHFDGMSIDEIGHALELSASATKHSIFRAVQKVRKALAPVVSAAR